MKDFQDRYSPMFRDATRGATDNADCCPPAELLAQLAAGRVWPWQRRKLVEHFSHCSDCADDFRVLTTARGGLLTALEGKGHAGKGLTIAWLRPGLAAAALVAVTVSLSLLVQTEGPGPIGGSGELFVSQFEPGTRQAQRQPEQDRLFISNFDEPQDRNAPLFRDDFGG